MFTYKGYNIHDAMIAIDSNYIDPHEAVISVRVMGANGEQVEANPKELMVFIHENYAALSKMCEMLHKQWAEATGQPPAQPSTRH